MNSKSKKLLSLFLVFSIMMLSVNIYAKERRGAKLIITKKDGQQIEDELITVKPNSLLLLNTEGKDVSIDIKDVKAIKIRGKSKSKIGATIGGLIGLVTGGLIGALSGDDPPYRILHMTWEVKALILGLSSGFLGVLIGAGIGAVAGTDKTIQIEGMTDSEIQESLEYLRKKARIRDYK